MAGSRHCCAEPQSLVSPTCLHLPAAHPMSTCGRFTTLAYQSEGLTALALTFCLVWVALVRCRVSAVSGTGARILALPMPMQAAKRQDYPCILLGVKGHHLCAHAVPLSGP